MTYSLLSIFPSTCDPLCCFFFRRPSRPWLKRVHGDQTSDRFGLIYTIISLILPLLSLTLAHFLSVRPLLQPAGHNFSQPRPGETGLPRKTSRFNARKAEKAGRAAGKSRYIPPPRSGIVTIYVRAEKPDRLQSTAEGGFQRKKRKTAAGNCQLIAHNGRY